MYDFFIRKLNKGIEEFMSLYKINELDLFFSAGVLANGLSWWQKGGF